MLSHNVTGAVIYIRVSTREQVDNLSLPTQLRACEDYCRREGFQVLATFREEGESAKTADRSELKKLLDFCRTHKGKIHFVIVYNLTRFAREKYDHFALRAHLQSLGISLRSVMEPIDDTSTGKLMEGVLASFAQFDNDVRSERTRAGMRAALELGRWTYPAPLGYRNSPKWSGQSLVHDPDRAPLVRRMFQEMATGHKTKQEVLRLVTELGLRTRHGHTLAPQTIQQMFRNPIYMGEVRSADGSIVRRGDFDPLVDEGTYYAVQAVLDGRVVVAGPRLRNHPDFPLRAFVRCETCQRPLTGSWSKGRNKHFSYYHCQRQCRAVNVTKAKLEGLFVEELALLQPSAGYMRLVNDRILHIWQQVRAEIRERTAAADRAVKTLTDKLDRLDEAYLFARTIDDETYRRQRDKLRQEWTLAKMAQHSDAIEEMDVEGLLAFAERILPRASDLWVQSTLDHKQRLQALFFPNGIGFDGVRFNRTVVTAPFFSYLRDEKSDNVKMVGLTVVSWNQVAGFLEGLNGLRKAA